MSWGPSPSTNGDSCCTLIDTNRQQVWTLLEEASKVVEAKQKTRVARERTSGKERGSVAQSRPDALIRIKRALADPGRHPRTHMPLVHRRSQPRPTNRQASF